LLLKKYQQNKSKRFWKLRTGDLSILSVVALLAFSLPFSAPAQAKQEQNTKENNPSCPKAAETSPDLACDTAFNKSVMEKVNRTVLDSFYSKEIANRIWPEALARQKEKILQAKNLLELTAALNSAIDELKTSHCKFLTINDDTFYFLNSLFHQGKNEPKAISTFPGFITGGAGFSSDTVRFVLDGSPAAKAGIKVADKILSVNEKPFVGQSNYFGGDRSKMAITLIRSGKLHKFELNVRKRKMYEMYCEAVEKSARQFTKSGLRLGYIRLWCGGRWAQEEMHAKLDEEPLRSCDGLILDLRDGYGACSLDALDPFYRQPAAYPDFEMTFRNGKKAINRSYFDKPMVALINGGSRSGKEMLAFSLRRTNRAKIIGETTAGYFVAGKLFAINEKCALYLAVQDCKLSGIRLEGVGVEPDTKVENDRTSSDDKQLETAKDELVNRINETRKMLENEAKTPS